MSCLFNCSLSALLLVVIQLVQGHVIQNNESGKSVPSLSSAQTTEPGIIVNPEASLSYPSVSEAIVAEAAGLASPPSAPSPPPSPRSPPPGPPPPPRAPWTKGGAPAPPLPKWNQRKLSVKVPEKKIAHTFPILHLADLNRNQVKSTVFNDLNYENLANALDKSFLEKMLTMDSQNEDIANELTSSPCTTDPTSPRLCTPPTGTSNAVAIKIDNSKKFLLDSIRVQNIGIMKRGLTKPVTVIRAAVNRLDQSALSQDDLEILGRIKLTSEEVKVYKDYALKNNGSFEGLLPEDQFIAHLSQIERLPEKLSILTFMAGFDKTVGLLLSQIRIVTSASNSIKEANHFHKVIEVILLVINANNGTRKPPVKSFKLSSLKLLVETKSFKDKSLTLMHVIAEIISSQYSELLNFTEQLILAKSGADVNMKSIDESIQVIEAQNKKALAEQSKEGIDAGSHQTVPHSLTSFLEKSKSQISSLSDSYKKAKEAFVECAEYYGETAVAQTDSAAFFDIINTFVKYFEQDDAVKTAKRQIEQKQLLDFERQLAQNQENSEAGRQILQDKMKGKREPDSSHSLEAESEMNHLEDGHVEASGDRLLMPSKSELTDNFLHSNIKYQKNRKLDSRQTNDIDTRCPNCGHVVASENGHVETSKIKKTPLLKKIKNIFNPKG